MRRGKGWIDIDLAVLEETNVVGVLTEALTAKIKTVLADESRALSADTATSGKRIFVIISVMKSVIIVMTVVMVVVVEA